MKEVLFSAFSVLFFILIATALAFNPLTTKFVNAQSELQAAEPPSQVAMNIQVPITVMPIAPPQSALELTSTLTPPKVSFEALHGDKQKLILNYDYHVTVNDDFSFKTYIHIKKKILKESARGSGELTFYYVKDRQRIRDIKAHTITPDGVVHSYSKIQDMKVPGSSGMYSDSRKKVVTLPKVNVGSIIEYSYVKESDRGPVVGAYWNDFLIAAKTPMKEVSIVYAFSKKIDIVYKAFNLTHEPFIADDAETITYSWHLKNLYSEPTTEDYLPYPTIDTITNAVEFSTIKSWGDVSDWYYKACQKALNITPGIKEAAINATKDANTLKMKVRAILEYIQDNFRYVSMSFGDNALEPHNTDEVFKNRYGDCKDLSLLCIAMLKAIDVKSDIALFNTESSLTDPQHDLPIPIMFDHTVVYVHERKEGFYVDTLLKGYDIGEYPLYYQGAYTFIINSNKGEHRRLPLFNHQRRYSKRVREITINEDGSSLVKVDSLWDLDFSIEARSRFKDITDAERKDLDNYLKNQLAPGGEVYLSERENLEDVRYGRANSRSEFLKPNAYNISDGILVIDIFGYPRLDALDKDKRENPIFNPSNYIEEEITTYNIPEGFEILSAPKDIDLDNGFFRVQRTYTVDKNRITLHDIETGTRNTISADRYPEIKEFYDTIPYKTSQRIILRRKQ